MRKIIYPAIEKVIEYNIIVLNVIKVKKADKPQVLSRQRIDEVIKECRNIKGEVYDKAVVLLKGLIQKHPFTSGNRRTAFITTKEFILSNKAEFGIKDDPSQARIMIGIREGYYNDLEIKEWIQYGKIRKFKR